MLTKTETFGTCSFHGHTFLASVKDIRKVFGDESYISDISGKSQHEWSFLTENDEYISIYNWKEYRKYSITTKIEWHIGALTSEISLKAFDEIKQLLGL